MFSDTLPSDVTGCSCSTNKGLTLGLLSAGDLLVVWDIGEVELISPVPSSNITASNVLLLRTSLAQIAASLDDDALHVLQTPMSSRQQVQQHIEESVKKSVKIWARTPLFCKVKMQYRFTCELSRQGASKFCFFHGSPVVLKYGDIFKRIFS